MSLLNDIRKEFKLSNIQIQSLILETGHYVSSFQLQDALEGSNLSPLPTISKKVTLYLLNAIALRLNIPDIPLDSSEDKLRELFNLILKTKQSD
ncbi:hypothetical protein A3715_18335 [Oleiphilus sp. HI0009]|nr:hypothetical protein A3715_18335 [Oleiphilus sp. HI0009]